MSFVFTNIDVDNKPNCLLYMKILSTDSMKPNKLKRHLETVHA